MKRHRTHQIEDKSKRIFEEALPESWVASEQQKDYGKDYLVEIGEDNGSRTESSFYVQLKGQEKVEFTADGSLVKFSLEKKYAEYYLDKIKDLPVFLVVADVNKKKAWNHFLQPGLDADQSWRQQKSATVYLSANNDFSDSAKLRQAVESAKQMMRLLHPESIQDAVAAHKRRVCAIDPRFDVRVSLVNETPMFELCPLEPVSGKIEFKGSKKKVEAKVSDLLDKGALVEFKPGEVKITGPPLFEHFEKTGGAMRSAVESPAAVSLVCRDAEGRELGRLADVSGRIKGGRKELWFEGGLGSSPLSVRLGPMGKDMGGSAKINWTLINWNGQKLLHLAFFDKLRDFGKALAASATTDIECQVHGNRFFFVNVGLDKAGFAKLFSEYLTLIDKARKVAGHFVVNPAWTFEAFDADSQETAHDLCAILFEGKLEEKMPNVSISLTCSRRTLKFDVLAQAKEKGLLPVSIVSEWVYTLLDEKIEVGKLTHEYTAVKIAEKRSRSGRAGKQRPKRNVELTVTGSEDTVRIIRPGDLPR
jgi:Domain of unknown function (DUF4365)